MAAPATEELREVARELEIAAESGETRSVEELRSAMGVSTAQLDELLSTLRENGRAVEIAPGEWRGPLMDEIEEAERAEAGEPARVKVRVADDGEGNGRRPVRSGVGFVAGEPSVRLTFGITSALEDAALGALVKAGIEDTPDGQVFVLEVVP